jgi:hypothetical protein
MKDLKHIKSFNEAQENLNISDVMFSFEDMKVFSKWCLENKQYRYETSGEFWFDNKTLKKLSWEEIWEIYNQN